MYKKDFWEYVKILLRTRTSYKLINKEIDSLDNLENMTAKQKLKIKTLLKECETDINKLIDELKSRNELQL